MYENSTLTKTQNLLRIRLRKYNPEKPPEDNYQEAQWQIDDISFIPQDDLHTFAWKTEFVGHHLDIPIRFTNSNAIDFDESYTQGPDTVIVPRSCFHDSSDGQNRENSDPSVVHPSNPKSHGQNPVLEIAKDLSHNDSSRATSESNTDIEIAYDSTQHPSSRQSVNPSTLEIIEPTNEIIPQNKLSPSRGVNTIYALNLIPITQ